MYSRCVAAGRGNNSASANRALASNHSHNRGWVGHDTGRRARILGRILCWWWWRGRGVFSRRRRWWISFRRRRNRIDRRSGRYGRIFAWVVWGLMDGGNSSFVDICTGSWAGLGTSRVGCWWSWLAWARGDCLLCQLQSSSFVLLAGALPSGPQEVTVTSRVL
jgi:hypothetical protein